MISSSRLNIRDWGSCDAEDRSTDRARDGNVPGRHRGFYELIEGKVVVTDLQGRPIGKEEAKLGDDPATIAKRILRRGRPARSDFYRPLPVRDVLY